MNIKIQVEGGVLGRPEQYDWVRLCRHNPSRCKFGADLICLHLASHADTIGPHLALAD